MESQELVHMTRDAGEEAYVRPEWVEEWVANGWKLAGAEPVKKPAAHRKAKDAE
jgi:hypothetical protein